MAVEGIQKQLQQPAQTEAAVSSCDRYPERSAELQAETSSRNQLRDYCNQRQVNKSAAPGGSIETQASRKHRSKSKLQAGHSTDAIATTSSTHPRQPEQAVTSAWGATASEPELQIQTHLLVSETNSTQSYNQSEATTSSKEKWSGRGEILGLSEGGQTKAARSYKQAVNVLDRDHRPRPAV